MKISIIGAGNLATNLANALHKAGHEIIEVYNRTLENATQLAGMVDAQSVGNLRDLSPRADMFIVSVKDDVVFDMASQLAKYMPNALIVHTAGALDIDVIPSKRRGVLYPLQTFSKQRLVDFSEIPLFIEAGSHKELDAIIGVARSISNKVLEINGQKRQTLHLAAVFCCNFVNHCAAISQLILSRNGIPFEVMLPLINETCEKMNDCLPTEAQTGPARRNDVNVMSGHVDLLNKMNEHEWADLYELLSKSIQNIC